VTEQEPEPQSSEDAVEGGALDESHEDGQKSASTEQPAEGGELDE
jgi:hypothetical protein